jgi:excisionase family DNA binding protein
MKTGTIQLIQITPDELQQEIISGMRAEIDKLKKEFQPKEPTEYLTRQQVKELLNVDISTIHNWTKRGKLKSYGLGNRVYYKRSEVESGIKPLAV